MRPSFHPRLINGPFEDPGLLVTLTFRKRALLFDLGDISALAPNDTLKIDHVFISHTHMDHFIGFDQLLRALLGRDKKIHLFGPKGFLKNLSGKLSAYTWNLVHNYSEAVQLRAVEIDGHQATTRHFDCRSGFKPSNPQSCTIHDDTVYQDPMFTVSAAQLDHQVPSLAFSLQERLHVNIMKTKLDEMGLPVGPWLTTFKNMIYSDIDPDTQIAVPSAEPDSTPRNYTLKELSPQIARITRGQKIAYVADAIYSPSNESKIVSLCHGADHLFIEAAFLESERSIAANKYHLTARQAGTIARKAKVKQMTVFHHSPRYSGQAHLLEQEAREAFEQK